MLSHPTLLGPLRSIITGAANGPEDALIEQLRSIADGKPAASMSVTVTATRRQGGPAVTPVSAT